MWTVEPRRGPPERTEATISPDGTRIAYLAPWKNRLNVWVQDLDSAAPPRCVTAVENRSVFFFHWADDSRRLLCLQDNDGDENWHLYRVELDHPDAAAVDLTPFPGAKVLSFELPRGRCGSAIVQLNSRKGLPSRGWCRPVRCRPGSRRAGGARSGRPPRADAQVELVGGTRR